MESYYITFYVQYEADSEESANIVAQNMVRRLREAEKVQEAVIVAVGRSPGAAND